MKSWVQVLKTAFCRNVGKGCVSPKVGTPFTDPTQVGATCTGLPYYYYYYYYYYCGGGGGGGAVVKLLPCDHEVETASFRNAGKCYVHKTQSGWPYPSPDPAQAGAMCTGLPFIYYLLKHMKHRLCFLCGVVLYLVVNLFSILHNFILFSVNIFFA
jgi:hypothetical protein